MLGEQARALLKGEQEFRMRLQPREALRKAKPKCEKAAGVAASGETLSRP